MKDLDPLGYEAGLDLMFIRTYENYRAVSTIGGPAPGLWKPSLRAQ